MLQEKWWGYMGEVEREGVQDVLDQNTLLNCFLVCNSNWKLYFKNMNLNQKHEMDNSLSIALMAQYESGTFP